MTERQLEVRKASLSERLLCQKGFSVRKGAACVCAYVCVRVRVCVKNTCMCVCMCVYLASLTPLALLRRVRAEMFKTDKSRWLSFFTTEIGTNLARVHHLYYYADFDTRDKVRAAVAADARWSSYLQQVKPHMVNQSSLIYKEASATLDAAGLGGALEFKTPQNEREKGPVCYELRRYQLKLGYDTYVPACRTRVCALRALVRLDVCACCCVCVRVGGH